MRVSQELKDSEVSKVYKAKEVNKDLRVYKVSKVFKVFKAKEVSRDIHS
jgi:hypothetical protein